MKEKKLSDKHHDSTSLRLDRSGSCTETVSSKFTRNIALFSAMFFLCLLSNHEARAQAFNIDQVRNGSAASPVSPVNWSNGNLTPTQAHYVEGYSVPYRAICTGLTSGVPVTLRIGYDTKDNGKNALDYLTYYDRMDVAGITHNSIFGHAPEVINPLQDVTGVSATEDLLAITAPASTVLPTNLPSGSSQPLTSFNNLAAAEKNLKIYGGTFVDGSFSYVSQDPIGADDDHAQTIVQFTFIPDGSTSVIAWGGHIASRLDWGYTDLVPNSAGGISGSPYHMRLISYTIGGELVSLGNQDRSLKASAVAAPPPVCQVIPATLEVCVGDTAEFLASATSGLPPYTFAWYKGTDFTTAIASTATLTIANAQQSDTGMYHVIVTDDFGLKDTCHAHLMVHPLPTCSIGSISPATLLCNQGNYTITTPLSIATYSFNWDMSVDGNPAGWAIVGSDTLKTITFSAGDCDTLGFQVHFTLYVTNRITGCQSSCTVSIAPRAPQCAVDIRPPVQLNCNVTSQYLLASYNTEIANPVFEWTRDTVSLGAGINDGTSLDSILINEPGVYRFTVTDSSNSANSCYGEVTVLQDTARPNLSETHTNVSCYGLANGAIDLSVSGGTGPFDYAWSNGDTIQDISGLAAGGYTVVVTGANGCSDSLAVTITEPADLAIAETHTNVACNGDSTGAIDITVSGGTPPSSFAWSNGATTEDISGLAAGAFEVIVTDSLGCMDSLTVNISQASDLVLAETHTNVSCYGDSTGAIDITVSGGTPPSSFAWNTGDTIEDLTGLVAGNYEVIVTDSLGCTDSLAVTIAQPDSLALTETHVNLSCYGDNSGSIDLTVAGGTVPYAYAWNNNDTIQDLTGLAAGNYEVIVTDSLGCMDSLAVTITQPDSLSIAETHTNVACYGDSTGAIDVTVTGGTTPYVYAWDNGETTEDLSGLAAGVYKLTVTDDNGCRDSIAVTITEPVDVSCLIDTPAVNPACGSTGNMLTASVTGATSYVWSVVGTGWSITAGQGNDTILYTAGSGSAVFKLVLDNGNNCLDSCEITLECSRVDQFCSLTQGFYGSLRGVACATGERGVNLVTRLLGAPFGNLVIGKPGRSLTITQADVACLVKRMPAGGPAAVLPSGNHVFEANCAVEIPLSNNGKFKNVLLGQTIALGFNLRLDGDLGGLVLGGTIMTTIEADPGTDGICGTEDDTPIGGDTTVRYIPQSVLDALNTLYGNTTVASLFDLANRALGGQSTAGASLNDINQAVSAINEGFDHCKFLVGFSDAISSLRMINNDQPDAYADEKDELDIAAQIQHSAFPNPFNTQTTIEVVSKKDALIQVEVFNVEGQRVVSLYNGHIAAGETKRVLFDTGNLPNGVYFYKINSGGVIYSSRLMLIR